MISTIPVRWNKIEHFHGNNNYSTTIKSLLTRRLLDVNGKHRIP